MDKTRIDMLAERVACLERECGQLKRSARRWRQASMVILVAFASLMAVGAKFADLPEFVEVTEGFLLKDKAGNVRASLAFHEEGPGLSLYVKGNQVPQIQLSLDNDGSRLLRLMDQTGKERLTLGPLKDNHVGMILNDGTEAQRIKMSVPPEGGPNIHLNDEKGHSLLGMSVAPNGDTAFRITDPTEKSQVSTLVTAKGASFFLVTDKDGQPVFEVPKP